MEERSQLPRLAGPIPYQSIFHRWAAGCPRTTPPRRLHCRPNIPPPPSGPFSPQPKSTHTQAQPDQPQSNRPPLVSGTEPAGRWYTLLLSGLARRL